MGLGSPTLALGPPTWGPRCWALGPSPRFSDVGPALLGPWAPPVRPWDPGLGPWLHGLGLLALGLGPQALGFGPPAVGLSPPLGFASLGLGVRPGFPSLGSPALVLKSWAPGLGSKGLGLGLPEISFGPLALGLGSSALNPHPRTPAVGLAPRAWTPDLSPTALGR